MNANRENEILNNLIVDSDNIEVMLAQWKKYVEMADNESDRRNQANKFYLSANSILIGFISIFNDSSAEYIFIAVSHIRNT